MITETIETTESQVWDVLNRNLFFVKDAVKRHELKTSDKFDIYDPATKQLILECREPNAGTLTKLARICGGEHDHGTSFDLVGRLPGSEEQVFRVTRGNTSLTLGGVPMRFFDHRNQLIGMMKKETFALGLKFTFSNEEKDIFVLQIKSKLLSSAKELLMDQKTVARLLASWKSEYGDFFREGKFSCALSIAPEFPTNSPARQILMGFCAVIGRVNA